MIPTKRKRGRAFVERVFGSDSFIGKTCVVLGLLFGILRLRCSTLRLRLHGAILRFRLLRLERRNERVLRESCLRIFGKDWRDYTNNGCAACDEQQGERIGGHVSGDSTDSNEKSRSVQ